MQRRLWGLDRRQTIVTFVIVVVVSVAIGLLLGPGGDGGGPAVEPPAIPRIEPGTPAPAHAVWVFGFETLRFDRSLQIVGRLPLQGFGDVHGSDGRVDLFDPGDGRVGTLTTARNRLREVGRVPPGVASGDGLVPTIADSGGARWLVTGPGSVRRVAGPAATAGPPIAVAPASAAPVATGVVASGSTVLVASSDERGVALARLDARSATVTRTRRFDVAGVFTLDGLATDGARLWVLAASRLYEIEPSTLAVARTVAVTGRAAGSVRGVVAAGGSAWCLGDNGSSLVRVDADVATVALRILPEVPDELRTPAGLVAIGDDVYAMVQRGATDHAVRVVGYDARRSRPTRGVDLPSTIFAGALAAT